MANREFTDKLIINNNAFVADVRDCMKNEMLELDKMVPKQLLDELTRTFEEKGLKLNVVSFSNPEQFVESYYKVRGYIVKKLEARWGSDFDIRLLKYFLKFKYNISLYSTSSTKRLSDDAKLNDIKDFINTPGVPDYLVYKEENGEMIDGFFVEVKTYDGNLSLAQMLWMLSNEFPCKVIYVRDDDFITRRY